MSQIVIPAWIDDKLTPVEKLEAHVLGLRHKAVSVFVLCGESILLQRRALGKYHTPGLWANTCCTHPHWGETSIDCANRRLDEELGLQNLDLQFRDSVEYRADVGGGLLEHEVVDIFVAHVASPPELRLNPSEVMGTEWVQYPDLRRDVVNRPSRYTPWLRIYLDDYADQILGSLAKSCKSARITPLSTG